jgi:DNA-binding LacI/PurR family transcriptional regulator
MSGAGMAAVAPGNITGPASPRSVLRQARGTAGKVLMACRIRVGIGLYGGLPKVARSTSQRRTGQVAQGKASGKQRPTMRDVAAGAGVSVQSVSNLLNGKTNHMTPETEVRIQHVIDRLGYKRNSTARGLRSQSMRTLAFIIGDASEEFLGDPLTDLFLAGFGGELRRNDYALLIDSYRPGDPLRSVTHHLDEGRADGAVVLLSGTLAERQRVTEHLCSRGYRLILLQEHTLTVPGLVSIAADDYAGSRKLCEHLLSMGHERITFVDAAENWSALEQRVLGYADAMRKAGLEHGIRVVAAASFSPVAGAEAASAVLGQDEPPTALMCGNDLIAVGALRAAANRGIQVPGDLAVTGFNDFSYAELITPSLTTVRVPGYEMGVAAATSLLHSADVPPQVRNSRYDVEIRLRESTGG